MKYAARLTNALKRQRLEERRQANGRQRRCPTPHPLCSAVRRTGPPSPGMVCTPNRCQPTTAPALRGLPSRHSSHPTPVVGHSGHHTALRGHCRPSSIVSHHRSFSIWPAVVLKSDDERRLHLKVLKGQIRAMLGEPWGTGTAPGGGGRCLPGRGAKNEGKWVFWASGVFGAGIALARSQALLPCAPPGGSDLGGSWDNCPGRYRPPPPWDGVSLKIQAALGRCRCLETFSDLADSQP